MELLLLLTLEFKSHQIYTYWSHYINSLKLFLVRLCYNKYSFNQVVWKYSRKEGYFIMVIKSLKRAKIQARSH